MNTLQKDSSLPWAVYDELLLEKIEEDHNIHKILFDSFDEQIRNEISNFFAIYIAGNPTQ